MTWTVAVVDLRTVFPPDQHDVPRFLPSRRLASRLTVRNIVNLFVHPFCTIALHGVPTLLPWPI
jgi:hypothetical protein